MKCALQVSRLILVGSVLMSSLGFGVDLGQLSCSYSGVARLKHLNGTLETCQVETTFSRRSSGELVFATSAQCDGGSVDTCSFVIVPGQNGFFDVRAGDQDGNIIGHGYCFADECHYSAFNGSLQETLVFSEGAAALHRLGSKRRSNGEASAWQADLTRDDVGK